MQSLREKLAIIFKYPLSPNQSIKGFFREMDTYGKISQKSMFDCIVCIADHVAEMDKNNSTESLESRISSIEIELTKPVDVPPLDTNPTNKKKR